MVVCSFSVNNSVDINKYCPRIKWFLLLMSTKVTSEKTQRDRLIKYKTRFPSVSVKNVASCEISTVNVVRASIFYNATKHVTNSTRKRSMPYDVCHIHKNVIHIE